MFKRSKTSDFTASLTHAWGYYTVAKDTSAPLVFAVERSYPITYREFPPRALIPPALDRFAEATRHARRRCASCSARSPSDAACTDGLARAVDGLLARGRAPLQPRADLGHSARSAAA